MVSKPSSKHDEELLAAVVPGILDLITSITPVERGAALAVANAMLIAGSRSWGREFSHHPMKIPRRTIGDALKVLADHSERLALAFDDIGDRPPSDPYVSACKWELVAVRVVMVTCACSLSRSNADTARRAWQMLSAARRSAPEAVDALMTYSKAYSLPPVPVVNGKVADKAYLTSLATNLPPMFRPKRRKG